MDAKGSFRRILPATILMVGALWAIATDPGRNETKAEARPLDGVWLFSRLVAPDVKAILDGWSGSTIVIETNKCTVQIAGRKTEYDVSTVVVDEKPFLVLHDEQGEAVRFLYELNGDALTLSYLPHAVSRRLDEGIVIKFKRRR